MDQGLPSSKNDSQNPRSDKVIPSQGHIQTSYLAHIRGKVISSSETNTRLWNQTELGLSPSSTTYWLCDL